ncbi:uncharacterized protein LOC144063039 isoform X2 [Vanacampus margaritifer]
MDISLTCLLFVLKFSSSVLSACEPELQELMRQIDIMMSQQRSEWEAQVRELRVQLKGGQEEISTSRVLIQRKDLEIGVLRKQVDDLQVGRQDLATKYEKQLGKVSEELDKLKRSYQKLERRHVKKANTEQSKSKEEDLSEVSILKDKLEEYSQRSLVYQKQLAELEAHKKSLNDELAHVKTQRASERQHADCCADVLRVRAQLETVHHELHAHKVELERFRAPEDTRLAHDYRETQDKTEEIERLHNDVSRLKHVLHDKEQAICSLEERMTCHNFAGVEKLREDLEKTSAELDRARTHEAHLSAQVTRLKERLEETSVQHVRAQQEARLLKDALDSSIEEVKRLREELSRAEQWHIGEVDVIRKQVGYYLRSSPTGLQPPVWLSSPFSYIRKKRQRKSKSASPSCSWRCSLRSSLARSCVLADRGAVRSAAGLPRRKPPDGAGAAAVEGGARADATPARAGRGGGRAGLARRARDRRSSQDRCGKRRRQRGDSLRRRHPASVLSTSLVGVSAAARRPQRLRREIRLHQASSGGTELRLALADGCLGGAFSGGRQGAAVPGEGEASLQGASAQAGRAHPGHGRHQRRQRVQAPPRQVFVKIPCDPCCSSSPPHPARPPTFLDMRTAEATPGTVLHRLIQEQLRFGNLTDTRALLAIQQQALRGSGGASGSPRSSKESLAQDECQYLHMSSRQDPQGQEYQGSRVHPEKPLRISYHGEELPTYEEARVHSQYLKRELDSGVDVHWDAKREHARSLSERLMRLSLEGRAPPGDVPAISSSHSFPQLYNAAAPVQGDPRGPPPGYPLREQQVYFLEPNAPPPFYSQHRTGSIPTRTSGDEADALRRENWRLRREVDSYAEKAARLLKLEDEIARISEAYETLMKGSAKREALEKTMRSKLEAQIKRMQDFNRDLKEQVCAAAKQRADKEAEFSEHKQHVFLKLLEQNEEQQRERERLERSIQSLRVSAEESQRGRELLEQAALSARARNRQLEDELQRKRAYVEKVERLQSSLGQLQAACEKREELEARLRTRLEQELKSMRVRQNPTSGPPASAPSSSPSQQQQQLREREERILALEADVTKWEQKYLEESAMRQFAMDAAATAAAQRDASIINNSPRHSPDSSFNEAPPPTNHRHQELENRCDRCMTRRQDVLCVIYGLRLAPVCVGRSRIRALHAQLLEKDATMKVLQQRSRWEQCKMDKQGLRPARSVPSIATAAISTETKGKSLSDDQTGGAVLPRNSARRDSGTRCDQPEPTSSGNSVVAASDAPEEAELGGVRAAGSGNDAIDSRMVEILI